MVKVGFLMFIAFMLFTASIMSATSALQRQMDALIAQSQAHRDTLHARRMRHIEFSRRHAPPE